MRKQERESEREACGEYEGRSRRRDSKGEAGRKAESSDEAEEELERKGRRRDGSGVESLETGKRRDRVEKPGRCIAERGRKEPKSGRRNARSGRRGRGTRGTKEGRPEMAEGLSRRARREEKPGRPKDKKMTGGKKAQGAKNRKLNCGRLQEKLKETYSYRMAKSQEVGYEH